MEVLATGGLTLPEHDDFPTADTIGRSPQRHGHLKGTPLGYTKDCTFHNLL